MRAQLTFQVSLAAGKKANMKWKEGDLWADDLQLQWEKDRSTKAAAKRKRAAEREATAADPFHNTHGKGQKSKKVAKKELKRARRQARARAQTDWRLGSASCTRSQRTQFPDSSLPSGRRQRHDEPGADGQAIQSAGALARRRLQPQEQESRKRQLAFPDTHQSGKERN
jgi:hypothetical protein